MKGKIFCFKSTAALVEFRRSWSGVEHRALVDFIGEDTFKIESVTPVGSVYKIIRCKDNASFASSMDEVLIQKEELEQYFEEVPTSSVHVTDVFDQKLQDVIAFMTVREYTKATEIINEQTKSGAVYMAFMIGLDPKIPLDAKNWLGAYMYNAAYEESKEQK